MAADTHSIWGAALDRFADLLDRIESALELGDFDDPGLGELLTAGNPDPLPPFPVDPELQRRATALRAEGERLAGLIAARRDELGAELSTGGDRRIAARRYRRAERLA
ncbi:MAG: hypothetical protein AAFZ07_14880 [Actinomycetota bacterium]